MPRILSLLILLIAAAPVVAQPSPSVKKLTVTPSAEPKPAMQYQFFTPVRDQVPGNAALHYLRASQVRPAPNPDREKYLAEVKQVQAWEDARIEDLPVKDVERFLERYRATFRELERGSRCDRNDWQYGPPRGGSILEMLLPSVQTHRDVTRYLSLRIKLELAQKQHETAIGSLQTGLTFGKRVAEGSTLIQMLVGLAITHIYLERVEDLIGRPGSPNLYWALSTLPRPFVDPRPALEGESQFFDAFAPGYEELRAGPVSPERAQELAELSIKALRTAGGRGEDPSFDALDGLFSKIGLAAHVTLHYPSAKKELIERGRPVKEVEAMPPTQVVLLNSFERVKVMTDDQMKWFLAPTPVGMREIQKLSEQASKMRSGSDALFAVFSLGMPATEKVFFAHARCERAIAALRAIEAIRMYAAANQGQVPKSLDDVTAVPVPLDPYTGKPFGYSVKGNSFTLTGPPPSGQEPNVGNTIRYEVTVARE